MKVVPRQITMFVAQHAWVRYVALLLFLIIADGVTWDLLSTPGLAGGGLQELLQGFPGILGETTIDMNVSLAYEINPIPILQDITLALVLCGAVVLAGRPAWTRIFLILYNAWVTLGIITTTMIIMMSLWNPEGMAIQFLIDVAIVWVFTIIVFTVWYWIIDSDRQAATAAGEPLCLDFAFHQSGATQGPWAGWKPGFLDYLFLSFTISISLSPTDTPCLTKRAKFLLMVQALISLVLILMIVARAINII